MPTVDNEILAELRSKRDFHKAEMNKYQGQIDELFNEKKEINERKRNTNKFNLEKKKTLDLMHDILSREGRLSTSELVLFLNDSIERTRDFDSMTFTSSMKKFIDADERFITERGKFEGRPTNFYNVL